MESIDLGYRFDAEVFRQKRQPAMVTDDLRVHGVAAWLVNEGGRGPPIASQMPVSPTLEKKKDRHQFPGRLAENILISRRTLRVLDAFEHASVDQRAKPLAENIGRDIELTLKVTESMLSVHHTTKNPERPAITDQVYRRQNRTAWLFRVRSDFPGSFESFSVIHGLNVTTMTCNMQVTRL